MDDSLHRLQGRDDQSHVRPQRSDSAAWREERAVGTGNEDSAEALGQVLLAFERLHTDELDVDFLLRSDPTKKFLGKLRRDKTLPVRPIPRPTKPRRQPAKPSRWLRPTCVSTATTFRRIGVCRQRCWWPGPKSTPRCAAAIGRWAIRCSTACRSSCSRKSCSGFNSRSG